MKVFLVRHGVTNEAEEGRRQYPESPLSEQGLAQARAAGKRLLKEEIDLIFSSQWPRALQTAEVIAEELGKEVKILAGLHEKETNPILHGVKFDDPVHIEHDEEIKKDWGNIDWKFRGEGESIRDILNRAAQFKKLLISDFPDKNIVTVTHSAFIKAFVTSAVLGEDFKDLDALNLFLAIKTTNTGISLLEFYPDSHSWSITYLNDHLHLRD